MSVGGLGQNKKKFTSYVPVKFNREHPRKKKLNGKSLPESPPEFNAVSVDVIIMIKAH